MDFGNGHLNYSNTPLQQFTYVNKRGKGYILRSKAKKSHLLTQNALFSNAENTCGIRFLFHKQISCLQLWHIDIGTYIGRIKIKLIE